MVLKKTMKFLKKEHCFFTKSTAFETYNRHICAQKAQKKQQYSLHFNK